MAGVALRLVVRMAQRVGRLAATAERVAGGEFAILLPETEKRGRLTALGDISGAPFIRKPFAADDLLAKIAEVLDRYTAPYENFVLVCAAV